MLLMGDLRSVLELPKFDGVLLVHYDYFEHHPSVLYDKFGLYAAWRLMQEAALEEQKQVFAVGTTVAKTDGLLCRPYDFIPPGTCEERVTAIVRSLDKAPEDISLLFGGILSDGCVYDHLVGMCSNCDDAGVGPSEDQPLFLSKTKIGYGRLVPELTEMCYRL